jgi:hypothetical protein
MQAADRIRDHSRYFARILLLLMLYVGIVTLPAGYASRLIPVVPAAQWAHLKLFASDATDLVLFKTFRNR